MNRSSNLDAVSTILWATHLGDKIMVSKLSCKRQASDFFQIYTVRVMLIFKSHGLVKTSIVVKTSVLFSFFGILSLISILALIVFYHKMITGIFF